MSFIKIDLSERNARGKKGYRRESLRCYILWELLDRFCCGESFSGKVDAAGEQLVVKRRDVAGRDKVADDFIVVLFVDGDLLETENICKIDVRLVVHAGDLGYLGDLP
jgi:hypothetical protein